MFALHRQRTSSCVARPRAGTSAGHAVGRWSPPPCDGQLEANLKVHRSRSVELWRNARSAASPRTAAPRQIRLKSPYVANVMGLRPPGPKQRLHNPHCFSAVSYRRLKQAGNGLHNLLVELEVEKTCSLAASSRSLTCSFIRAPSRIWPIATTELMMRCGSISRCRLRREIDPQMPLRPGNIACAAKQHVWHKEQLKDTCNCTHVREPFLFARPVTNEKMMETRARIF